MREDEYGVRVYNTCMPKTTTNGSPNESGLLRTAQYWVL